tara:strand:- start:2909 stop:3406 length:498 start_codon:yes stop_codon:yes gene_type:complete
VPNKLYFFIIFSLIFFGCSSGNVSEDEKIISTEEFSYYSITKEDGSYNVDNFVIAGWKKSKSFITDAVSKEGKPLTPDAKEIWYGFYNRKDIEIRFYEDHSKAISSGADSAETAVGRAVNANSKGGIITSTNNRVSYQSYVIAGNAVILCQDLLNNCQDLADRLE